MPDRVIHLVPVLADDVLEIGRRYLPAGFELRPVSKADLPIHLAEIEFLLGMEPGWIDDDKLAAAEKLKLVQLMNVGYDSFNVEGARKAGVPVAINGGANAIAVAEHTLMFILALLKQLPRLDENVRAGVWRGGALGGLKIHEIWSQTIGVFGMGRIGQEVVKRLRPFEPGEIVYFDPFRQPPGRERELGVRYVSKDELLKISDVVTVHVPLTPETHHWIDETALRLMKPTAVLINTSRGGLVDEAALAEALEQGIIAGAGLDVFAQEPPSPDNPLLKLKNALLTPHMAGPTWESYPRRFKNCFENIERVANGEPPLWVIPELADLVPQPTRR
ncbi:MAG TPA: 2-hydroxyacid dehydrogenase [Chloroflexota bacterium]|jgi:glyoxylate reductase/D-3-phosphoglycerate dehydrogenase|nr:2-hydroxyacid dehydrogenase [Chloroflexota bacterium]